MYLKRQAKHKGSINMLEEVISHHSSEITDIQRALTDLTSRMSVLMAEQGHLSKDVEKILSVLETIKLDNEKCSQFLQKINSLEAEHHEYKQIVKKLEIKSNRWSNALLFVRQNWVIIMFIISAVGAIIEYVYRLPPPS